MKAFHLTLILLTLSCSAPEKSHEELVAEIAMAEKNFNDLAQSQGIVKAFATYAAENAVIKRGGKLISGNDAIKAFYQQDTQLGETLEWKPTFIDVSQSGDLGYTYGTFVFSYPDSTGTMQTSNGFFHSVWKRQADGQWKFVWD